VTEIPTAVEECADLGQFLSMVAAVQRHDDRLAAADSATAERLADLGASAAATDADELLAAECDACRRTGRDCGARSYRGMFPLDGSTPEPGHPELRQLLNALGMDLTRCCGRCSHDQFGHRAHDRAVAQARAEHRTSPAAALAALEGRRFDPSLAPVSTATREEEN
jgi:hypothetical protein